MRNRHPTPNSQAQRGQASLWPWGLALGLALALSAWWAWDLFKPPSEDSAHPRLPSATGHASQGAKAQPLKLEGSQGLITEPPTGTGNGHATDAAAPSGAY